MREEPHASTDQPVTNVLQIIALNTICVAMTVAGLKLFGFSWSTAIFLGWPGAILFTLAIAFGIICSADRRSGGGAPAETTRQTVKSAIRPRPRVSTAALIEMWQEDVLKEDWTALKENRRGRGAKHAGEREARMDLRRQNIR